MKVRYPKAINQTPSVLILSFILEGLNKLKKNAAPIAPNGLSSFLKNRIAIKKHKTAVIG